MSELAGSRPTAPEPSEAYNSLWYWLSKAEFKLPADLWTNICRELMAYRAALGGSPQPPAGDVLGRIASWDIYQTEDGLVQHFVADVRAALRGGNQQPEDGT